MKSSLLSKVGIVLETVCSINHPVAIKELTEILDMPLPTVSRLCSDLVEIGLLEKTDYHHLIPGISLIRFGQNARRLSPLISSIRPHIDAYSAVSGLSASVYGFARDDFFHIYSNRSGSTIHDPMRYSGAFLVLMAAAGKSVEAAIKIVKSKYPDMTETEKVICDREYSVLKEKKFLTRVAPGRKWIISMPFHYENTVCSLSFYGLGRENSTVEAELFEISKVMSRIRSGLERIGKGDSEGK